MANPYPANVYTTQPGPVEQWMRKPYNDGKCPSGLEYLTQVDRLQVEQIPRLLQALFGFEQNTKFYIRNSQGENIYFAGEETDMCMRLCCGPLRGFSYHLYDGLNERVMSVTREFKCCAGCCWCAGACPETCAFEVFITTPTGSPIGYVKQLGSCCRPKIEVADENKQPHHIIEGPWFCWDGPLCPCDTEFKVMDLSLHNQVGVVTKQYAGCFNEACTNADNYGISFPADLDPKKKASLIGSMLLINMMFFENNNKNNNNN